MLSNLRSSQRQVKEVREFSFPSTFNQQPVSYYVVEKKACKYFEVKDNMSQLHKKITRHTYI